MNCKKSSKVNLYLMRHGQTILNRAERTQGWCDGVLTEEGIEVAKDVAAGLSDIEFKAAYSSDLGRAIKTARIVIKGNKVSGNLQVNEVPELRETCFGKYEGEKEKIMRKDMLNYFKMDSFEEVIKKIPEFDKAFVNTCAALDETGTAEDYDTLMKRIKGGVQNISEHISEQGGGNVLLVVHGGMLRILLTSIDKNINVREMENSSVSMVEYDNGNFKVLSVNDMSYRRKGEKLRKK
ncbi:MULTISPECIES: histidine phosphatase family protein [Clostridium]|uniref:histidine phosphatase family protein n=1 Tax=Clostridium TaxID=1485 RepID=UPI00082715FC|nr:MULTISPECIES: histidine phosphatase family protein [Clostridium]PJI06981.1 histidine phosphatase family protein [Clostridium sp. CT7]